MDWAGVLVSSRYDAIGRIASEVVLHGAERGPSQSDKIDAVVTHPLWGWLILGGVMTLIFLRLVTFAI